MKNKKSRGEQVILPENEYLLFKEILKSPLGINDLYEISLEAKDIFDGCVSPKTLLNAAKNKLVDRKVIAIYSRGDPATRAVVKVLNYNVQFSNNGQGRKVNRASEYTSNMWKKTISRYQSLKTASQSLGLLIEAKPRAAKKWGVAKGVLDQMIEEW